MSYTYVPFQTAVQNGLLTSPHDLDYLTDGPKAVPLETLIRTIGPNIEKSGCSPDDPRHDTPVAVVSPVRMADARGEKHQVFLFNPGNGWYVGLPSIARAWPQSKVLFAYAKKTYMCCPRGTRFAADGTDHLKHGCYTGHLPLAKDYPNGPTWVAEGRLRSIADVPELRPREMDTYQYTVDDSHFDQADVADVDGAEADGGASDTLWMAAEGYGDQATAYPSETSHDLL